MNSGEVIMRPMHAESFTGCGGLKHQRDMNMSRYISKGVLLLTLSLVICCGLYLLSLWVIGQPLFPFQANSIMLTAPDSKVFGSRQSAQPFTKDEYFQPRPSAASYDASVSTSSAVSASNNFFHQQNRDFGVAEVPQSPAGKVCLFYDC
jgi:K+-transporting ATPase c subunit